MNSITQAATTMAQAAYTEPKTSKVNSGKTIGSPKLSEKAQKYYEQLKKKFSNMDFILVSEEKKEEAQANAAQYANANRMVVLIDTEKVERMAEDESYRKQYEGIISGAAVQLSEVKDSLKSASDCVKTYGMKFDDKGTASFFAVIDKSLAAQKKRIEKNAIKKKEEKKKAEEKRAEKRRGKKEYQEEQVKGTEKEDTITLEATSLEELLRKIKNIYYFGSDNLVLTEKEKNIGQHVNYTI